jgi:hypothetical protein
MRPVSLTQYKVLDHLAGGGRLLSHRAYPFPRRYYLVQKLDELIESKTPEVSETAVAGLVGKGLVASVRPAGDDPAAWDRIEFTVTAAGQHAWEGHPATVKRAAVSEKGAG